MDITGIITARDFNVGGDVAIPGGRPLQELVDDPDVDTSWLNEQWLIDGLRSGHLAHEASSEPTPAAGGLEPSVGAHNGVGSEGAADETEDDDPDGFEPREISAAAAALAEEHGLDLDEVEGTGSHGNVIVADVRRALAARDG